MKSGKTCLHFAVAAQKVDLVQFLLGTCKAKVNARSYAGQTATYIAWTMFKAFPNNSRIKSIILTLVENGGEPRSEIVTAANDSEGEYDSTSSDEEEDVLTAA